MQNNMGEEFKFENKPDENENKKGDDLDFQDEYDPDGARMSVSDFHRLMESLYKNGKDKK